MNNISASYLISSVSAWMHLMILSELLSSLLFVCCELALFSVLLYDLDGILFFRC